MANTSLHQDLSSKINFPVTSTTGSKPSLTSYCWTQSLRHSWGGSITNISELDQFIIRAINRGPFHSTVAKAQKLIPTYFSPGNRGTGEPRNRGTEEPRNRGTGEPRNRGTGEPDSSIAKGLTDSEDPKHTLFCRENAQLRHFLSENL